MRGRQEDTVRRDQPGEREQRDEAGHGIQQPARPESRPDPILDAPSCGLEGLVIGIGPARNVDAWYDAFNVKPGDKYYLAPSARVRLW